MIAYKHITKIIAAVMAVAVCLCLCAAGFSENIKSALGDTGVSMEYESELFDTGSIITVNIIMDEADWNDMLQNAVSEEYYACDVEVNGTMFYHVAIRPKGNTSLSSIASDPTTDRYSFKLEFDLYVDGQTCFGLDKLVLNSNYADATNMKEALIYDMYQYIGADASLYNYAKISVNGEYWGVYLALEAVEDSFLLRNYGVQTGALYKPEGVNDGGGAPDAGFGGGEIKFGGDAPEGGGFSPGDAPQSFSPGAQPGGGSGGADLNYTDDELDSYQTIWDGEIGSSSDADHARVVSALRSISEGSNLEGAMDVDNLLRYMAVHVFSVNEDSLSGSMAHNYYLYESGGRLNLIPWDYNLALGGMGSSSASDVVNSPIDDAFSGTTFFDTLMADETYHSRYYAYLQQLVGEYIERGGFDAFYERVRSQIDELVEADPTAFYSYEEYLTAADTLYQTVKLRGQSIQGQLDGTIPSTADAQRGSAALIDASSLDISAMGSMNAGEAPRAGSPSAPVGAGGEAADGSSERRFSSPVPPGTGDGAAPGSEPPNSGGTPPKGSALPQFDAAGQSVGDAQPLAETSVDSDVQRVSVKNLLPYVLALAVMSAAMLFAVLYRRNPRRSRVRAK